MAISCSVVMAFYLLMISQVYMQKGGILYSIGYVGCGLQGLTFMLSNLLLSKIVNKETRGTMYSLNGFVDSLAIALANGLGGFLFDSVSNTAPYILALSFYLAFFISTVYFGLTGRVM